MRSSTWMFGLALAPLCVCPAALAQSAEEDMALVYGDKQTISIATGSSRLLRRAPAVATVITAEDIAALGASDLDQVLESVPGLHVSANAGIFYSVYAIRGAYFLPQNPQVLLLRNGIPYSSLYTGDKGSSWAGMPLDNVARIEVIRGPGSALYGADAFAGVINVITKTADQLSGARLGLRAGAFGTREAWAQYGGPLGPFSLAAYLKAGRTDGQSRLIEADAATRLDKLFGTQSSRAPGPFNTGRHSLDAALDLGLGNWHLRTDLADRPRVELGAGVNSALDPTSYSSSLRHSLELNWGNAALSQDWGAGASLSFVRYTDQTPAGLMLFPPGTRIGPNVFPDGMIGGPSRWERQYRLSAFVSYSGWQNHALRVGLGHEDLNMYKTRTMKNFLLSPTGLPIPNGPVMDYTDIQPHIPPSRRRNIYAYVQDEWQLAPDWTLTAGLRHDEFSDFGGTTNPRAALVWDAAYNLSVKLLYGQAFRAPSANEQYSVNPVTTGNPQLTAERIKTTELAFDWQPAPNWQAKLSLYDYEMQDIIRVVQNPAPAPGASYQNLGRINGRGFELELQWDASRDLRLSAQLSQQQSVDPNTGLHLGYVPGHHGFARADWRIAGDWQLGAQLSTVRDRRRPPGDARPALANYNSLDLNLRGQAAALGLNWALLLRNALDADIREPSQPGGTLPNDLPMAGRYWGLEVGYRF